MIRRLAILCSLLTILIMVCTQASQAEKLTLVGGDIIVNIDSANNSGSTQIHLRNDTEESIKISLHAKNFILQTRQKEISAQVIFQQSNSQKKGPVLETELAKDQSIFVLLEITDFAEAGEAHAYLYNRDERLTTIKAVKFNVPFKVSLDAANPINPKLTFQRGKTGTLVF